MNEKKIDVRVYTPEEVKVAEKADIAIMRCVNGDTGIMRDHDARSYLLGNGVLRIVNDGAEHRYVVFGGFAEIRDNLLTIVTDEAWRLDE